jgi:hypothetical protein
MDLMLTDSSGDLPMYAMYKKWVEGRARNIEGEEIVRILVDAYIKRPD